jgi:hypothetical protein
VWVTGSADLFVFGAINSTQQLIFNLNPAAIDTTNFPSAAGGVFPTGGIIISFANPSPVAGSNDSIGPVLGFPTTGVDSSFTAPAGSAAVYSKVAPDAGGFSDTSAYSLYMSIVDHSYINGQTGSLLYSFPLGANQPNSVVSFQPTLPYIVPIGSGTYSSISVYTTDQDGNRLPLRYYQAPFQFQVMITKNREDGSI